MGFCLGVMSSLLQNMWIIEWGLCRNSGGPEVSRKSTPNTHTYTPFLIDLPGLVTARQLLKAATNASCPVQPPLPHLHMLLQWACSPAMLPRACWGFAVLATILLYLELTSLFRKADTNGVWASFHLGDWFPRPGSPEPNSVWPHLHSFHSSSADLSYSHVLLLGQKILDSIFKVPHLTPHP